MGGRGNPGRSRGQARGSPRGGPRGSPRGSSPAPSGDRGRGGGFRGRGDFRGGPPRGGGDGGYRGRGRGGGGSPPPPLASLGAARQSAEEQVRITELEKSIVRFKELPHSDAHPLRPGFGSLGAKIFLRANFFQIRFKKGLVIHDYDVKITPSTAIEHSKGRIFELLEQKPEFRRFKPFIAHDRSQRVVCPRALPQPLSFDITYTEEEETNPSSDAKTYTIEITKTGELHTDEMTKFLEADISQRDYDSGPMLGALNLALSMQASRTGVRVGKNRHFFTPEERSMIGPGVEAWRGFYSSVRPVYKSLMVNVNVCMTAFVEGRNLGDAIREFQYVSKGAFPDLTAMFGNGNIKIKTLHNGYKKRLRAIGPQTAAQQTFLEDGRQITVANYFRRKHPNFPLQYADRLPVVNVAIEPEECWIPAELCQIVSGIPWGKKLTDTQTSTMLQLACKPPATNAQTIVNEGFQKLGFNPAALGEPINNFEITISTTMAVIPGRILPPPGLSYRNNNRPTTRDGSWNILDVKFQRGGNMENWAVLMVLEQGRARFKGPTDPEMWKLIQGFRNKCASAGMTVPNERPRLEEAGPLSPWCKEDPSRQTAVNKLKAAVEKLMNPRPSFILVLLDHRDNYIYPSLKKLCDVDLGVATVCMQLNKAMKEQGQDQYFSNVALKVNTKLGGFNHLLDDKDIKWLKQKRTMIVGADVTHPGPTSIRGTPSIAAVVASIDMHFVQYPASLRLNESKVEMISDMGEMMIERLQLWQQRNNNLLPERIFMFRDGVSEGQFDTVLRKELPLMRTAFDRVYGTGKKPTLTITICGKRHHARFYPMNNEEASRNGNTKPGTVVDKGVTDVFRFDYYLQAHNGLQGTVRPTHYSVIYDENKLQADEIQQGTHTASYQYARATKAVSLIPPAYYADLACERARLYLNDLLNLGSGAASSARDKKRDKEAEKKIFDRAVAAWGHGIHPNLRETMFYI